MADEDAASLLHETRELLKGSLFNVCHAIGFKDVNARTHGKIIETLEDKENTRKLICVPRGCLKSSIACVAYPIWLLLNDPNLRIFIDSELYTNSKTFIREIRSHLEGDRLPAIFGQFKGDLWSEGAITIKQRTQIKKEPSISAGGIGTTRVGQHHDVQIMDDMNSQNNSNSPEKCAAVVNHYRHNISILDPGGTMIVIGTRFSAADLLGFLLNNEENTYQSINGLISSRAEG